MTIILISLIFLYVSKRLVTRQLSKLIRKFGGGNRAIIWLWSIIFLPGTILHEVSHFLVAAATGARTGGVEIFPDILEKDWEAEEKGKGTVLGYVQTQKLNPIRGFLVGLAPFISGLALLIWLTSLLQTSFDSRAYTLFFLEVYLFFTIANSFFPSWSDIKQTLPLLVILAISLGIALFFGFHLQFVQAWPQIQNLAAVLSLALLLSVIVNTLVLSILFILNHLFRR